MKTDLKPTDPEYIEALSKYMYNESDMINLLGNEICEQASIGFVSGYNAALSHTNHAELVEKAKAVLFEHIELIKKYNSLIDTEEKDYIDFQSCAELSEALTKSETSKL